MNPPSETPSIFSNNFRTGGLFGSNYPVQDSFGGNHERTIFARQEQKKLSMTFRSKNPKLDNKHIVRCVALSEGSYGYCKRQLRIKSLQQNRSSILEPSNSRLNTKQSERSLGSGFQLQFNKSEQLNHALQFKPSFISSSVSQPSLPPPKNNLSIFDYSSRKSLFGSQVIQSNSSFVSKSEREESVPTTKTPIQNFYSAFTSTLSPAKDSSHATHSQENLHIPEQIVNKVLKTLAATDQFKHFIRNGPNFSLEYFTGEVMRKLKEEERKVNKFE